jgi:hypothetical protein
MYIGNITLPAVESFNVGDSEKPTEAVGGLGTSGYDMAEYGSQLPECSISGYLFQLYGDSRTLRFAVEDAQSVRQRSGAFNYISANNRKGWFYCSQQSIPYSAGVLWDFDLTGQWLDAAEYISRFHCRPVTRENDFGISGENWISLPVGSVYSTDATTETVASEDGDITRVQTDIIEFELDAVESEKGEVRCFDGSTQVFNHATTYQNDIVISNGLYRITVSNAADTITVEYWNGSVYTEIDEFSASNMVWVRTTEVTPDKVVCKTGSGIVVTVERGRVPHIYTPEILACSTLTPADQTTADDNYLELGTDIYAASDRSFSVSSGEIGAGNLWIYHDATTPATTAQNALVISNMKREVVEK